MKFVSATIACASLLLASAATAQLRNFAETPDQCPRVSNQFAESIFRAQKLKLDQRHWSQRDQAVRKDVTYQSSLRALEVEKQRDINKFDRECLGHFRSNIRQPWYVSWSHQSGLRYRY